jgi:hypothetical protein
MNVGLSPATGTEDNFKQPPPASAFTHPSVILAFLLTFVIMIQFNLLIKHSFLQGLDEPHNVFHVVVQRRDDRAGIQLAQGIIFQHLCDGLSAGTPHHFNRTVCRAA